MTDIIRTLKASIGFEQSKRSVTNLLNHKPGDLAFMIDDINRSIKECQGIITETQNTIDNAEDMAEIIETTFRGMIAEQYVRMENLYAWRVIFLNAWMEASRK